ncbi:hypothetical protein ABIF65_006725 [Bradyrhizobium japonicum]|jgi:hypothetical protein|nr:hypothetical protein [Bradyrhizobium japonicum]MCP1776108.1 hypothetical protein [Bradyrhizobium japonicum]MCP1862678.1 hypothetical protein [Bradyrhizobium japonicum]MCP1893532.1 hypothetical protein [Bradyrhizobium japonicum]MCP1960893.1 hypothetical protein [Bradyrhizobium japonicum]
MTNRSSGSCGGREFLRGPRDGPAQAYLQSRNPGFIYANWYTNSVCADWP